MASGMTFQLCLGLAMIALTPAAALGGFIRGWSEFLDPAAEEPASVQAVAATPAASKPADQLWAEPISTPVVGPAAPPSAPEQSSAELAADTAEQSAVAPLAEPQAAAAPAVKKEVPNPGPSPCEDTMSAKDWTLSESRCNRWKMMVKAKEHQLQALERAHQSEQQAKERAKQSELQAKERAQQNKIKLQGTAFNKDSRAPMDTSTFEERQAEQCRFQEDAWQEYSKLHQQGLQDLASGKPADVLVWRCESEDLCGGNTDQLSGILKTFLLAVRTKRVFLVDWNRSGMNMEQLFPQSHIQWKFTDTHRQICHQNSSSFLRSGKHSWPGDDDLQLSLISNKPCVVFRTNMDPKRRDAEKAGLDQYRIGCYFHYLFGTSQLLKDAVHKRHPAVSGKPYAAVHIRMGDWWMDTKLSARSLYHSSDLVLGTMLDCSRNMSGTDMPVMVYTDAYCIKAFALNSSWLDERQDEKRIFTTIDQNRSIFVPSHTDDGHNQGLNGEVDWIPDPKVMQEKLLDSWADQFGMVGATHLIKSSWSGFSKMAAEIALMDPKSVRLFYVKGNLERVESVRCDVLSREYSNIYW